MSKKDINLRFDEKIKEMEETLAYRKGANNCAASTFISVLDVLGIENYSYYNLSIPLAGGFGGFKSVKGWKGPCGAVCGACAAIGIVMGGQERTTDEDIPKIYLKAAKYVQNFEKEFGSVSCEELCGHDFSDPQGYIDYTKNKVWENKCYKYIIWAVNEVRKITKRELKKKWE
ncbi:MAG: C-GCAxxG-C-C family protein [Promethearchaeota archaeon]